MKTSTALFAALLAGALLASPVATQRSARQAPSASPETPGPRALKTLCVDALHDRATGACLHASSIPTPGHLLPLGPYLMVDPTGRVGIGTSTPARDLDVVGVIRSWTGIEYPDGTLQTTATLQGPPGPAGPQGPLVPPPPTTVLGTIDFGSPCAPMPFYDLNHVVDLNQPSPMLLEVVVEEACGGGLYSRFLAGSSLSGDVVLQLGDLTLTAVRPSGGPGVLITDYELLVEPGLSPRERVSLSFAEIQWSWTGPGGAASASWNFQTQSGPFTGLPSPLTFVSPGPTPPPKGESEIYALQHAPDPFVSIPPVVLEKPVDALSPNLAYHAVWRPSDLSHAQFDADVLVVRDVGGTERTVLQLGLGDALVERYELSLSPTRGLVETLVLKPTTLSALFL